MGKPSTNIKFSELDEVKVDLESTTDYNYMDRVALRSLIDARLIHTGQETGEQYIWEKAGSIVWVSALDSESLLTKRLGKKLCCGNSKDGNKLFELVY